MKRIKTKNALDALEKLLQQEINPEPENTGNQDQTTFDDSYLSDNIVEARTDDGKAFVCIVILINKTKNIKL